MRLIVSLILVFIYNLSVNTDQNSYSPTKAIFNENSAIENMLFNYSDAIEQKDYKKMENYLTDDFEYYCIVRHRSNRKQYIKIVERNLTKYKKIVVRISEIEIFPDNETPHDLKVIYNQTTYKDKHISRIVKTVRVFKGDETKFKWKIYREFDDAVPDKKNAISYNPEKKMEKKEIDDGITSFWKTVFTIGNILCAAISFSFGGVIIFIFYKTIRLYIFEKS